ncbi:MAG: RadC family protein [Alphaproteobacteria bacterium]|jgi:DNA repair protein radC|uniref:RadC family protein n=1 Tax=Candidatus Scatocola faecigallinarum TaxID=2840916 RepID=UPI0003413197|nr:dNA repair protein RadC [Azospirillum sp. CAG:239]
MAENVTNDEPDYLGHRERLRRRFLLGGGRDMPDYELLELLLTIAIPRRDVKPLAKELIRKFGSFAEVVNAPLEELMLVKGVKENTAAVLRIVRECSVRSSWQSLKGMDAPVISDFDAMVDYCRSAMAYQTVEEFRIIFLNSKLYVIGEEIQQRGTVDQVAIHPREVIKSAMMHGASAMILVHNHPSGIVTPSKADIEITKRIKEAAEAVSIRLFDHLIISKSSVYSFHNQGFV